MTLFSAATRFMPTRCLHACMQIRVQGTMTVRMPNNQMGMLTVSAPAMPLNCVPISVRASARLGDALPEASAASASAAASRSPSEISGGSLGAMSSASAASPGVMGREAAWLGLEGLGVVLPGWAGVMGVWPMSAVASSGAC